MVDDKRGGFKQKERQHASLKGKVVLVVSAAQDLGYELAVSLSKHGCRIVLAGSLDLVHPVSNQIRDLARESQASVDVVKGVELDLRAGEASIEAAVDQAWKSFGTIDVLLTCSAIPGELKSPLEYSEGDWDETMGVNLKTPWLLMKAVGQQMRQAGRGGSIIFVSSISGIERGLYPGVSVHGAAMAALHQLTKSMAMELGKYGISVMAIARGLSKADPLLASMSEEQFKKTSNVVPMRRWMTPADDLEALVLFLASDSGRYSTANVFIADGGQSLPRPRMRSFM